jgi:dienelactone hydrolase
VSKLKRHSFACAALLALAISSANAFDLQEQIVMIPKPGLFSVKLETTIYKPQGNGPFPLAIINHGKALGNPKLQSRYRPMPAVSYFLQRGYAVVVPMRQGFGNSGGSYVNPECDLERNGYGQAEDVEAVLKHMSEQPFVNKDNVLVLGQSHGGLTTLAFGTKNYPGVRGLINFAGGLKQQTCPGWESGLAHAAGAYAKHTKVPSLWFYGENDSYFSPSIYNSMYQRYTEAGGPARLVAYGKFGSDAHGMFGSRRGESIWQPEVTRFLEELGLPTEVVFPEYALPPPMDAPPRTDYAAVNDVSAVPLLNEDARQTYRAFLDKEIPRAFAVAPDGTYGWASQGEDPIKRALESCNKQAEGLCKLYAVDDFVVWPSSRQTASSQRRDQ